MAMERKYPVQILAMERTDDLWAVQRSCQGGRLVSMSIPVGGVAVILD